jgi:hypothetical protein
LHNQEDNRANAAHP